MKRLYLSFFPAELDFYMAAAEIGDVTVDLCVDGSGLRFENFRVRGCPMKAWVVDHNYKEMMELVKSEINPDHYSDGDCVKIGGNKYEVHLLFGNPSQSYKTYFFDTQHEADLFMEGVEAVDGWHRVINPEDADEEDLESLEIENENDFKRLQRYLAAKIDPGGNDLRRRSFDQ